MIMEKNKELKRKNLRQIYDERAAEVAYDPSKKLTEGKHPRKYAEIIKYLDFEKNSNVIEVGCGTGPYITYLSKLNKHPLIVASDISPKILLEARKRVENEGNKEVVCFVACDMESLPFKNGSFDNILATQVIEHLFNDEKGLEELYRILKRDGVLIISTDNRNNYVSRIIELPVELFKSIFKLRRTFWEYPHRDYLPKDFKSKVERFFAVRKFSTFRFSLPYPFYKIKIAVQLINLIEYVLIKLPLFKYCGDIIVIEARKSQKLTNQRWRDIND